MTIDHYANRFVCDLVAYEPGKPIDETARELGLDPSQIVKVASNENPLGPSPLAKIAMREAIEEAHIYPDGGGYRLRSAIADSLGMERPAGALVSEVQPNSPAAQAGLQRGDVIVAQRPGVDGLRNPARDRDHRAHK